MRYYCQKCRIMLFVMLGIGLFPGCAMFWYHTEETKALSSNLKEVDLYETRFYPVTPFGHNNCVFYIPVPFLFKTLIRQDVLYQDEMVWSNSFDYDYSFDHGHQRNIFFVAPDEYKIFVEDQSNHKPSFIVDLRERSINKKIGLLLPTLINRIQYDYPLRFVAWEKDSRTIICKTSDYLGDDYTYEGAWEIDVDTGVVRPFAGGLKYKKK